MFCSNCGTQNEDPARFCMKCGAQLVTVVPPSATEAGPSRVGRVVKWVIAIGGVIGLLAALVIGGLWAYRSFAPTGGRIVFFRLDESGQGTHYSLWVTRPDGSEPVALFHDAEDIDVPRDPLDTNWVQLTSLAPDGKTLLFGKQETGEEMVWYRADLAGESPVALTDPGESAATRFSPDGRKILTQVERSHGYDLYVFDASGSNRVRVSTIGNSGYATFSSDSRRLIIWDAGDQGDRGDLYTIDLSGKDRVDLASRAYEARAEYAHKGNKLLLTLRKDSDTLTELFLADARGKNRKVLGRADEIRAYFSPDDKRIVVTTTRSGRHSLIIFDGKGERLQDVATNAEDVGQVTFTPNSRWLAFSAKRDGEWSLNVVDVDGQRPKEIHTGMEVVGLQISPDSRRILFAVQRSSGVAAYVSSLDGADKRVLSQGADFICGLHFSPDGKKIVYSEEVDDKHTVFIAEADGSEKTALIEGGLCPAWSK